MYALSARGETPRTPPLSPPFNLVVGKVDRLLMRVYSIENENATFSTGQLVVIPERAVPGFCTTIVFFFVFSPTI